MNLTRVWRSLIYCPLAVSWVVFAQVKGISGTEDTFIPDPPKTGVKRPVQQDAAAVTEIDNYLQKVGGNAWSDLQGVGTFYRGAESTSAPGTATLYMLGLSSYRLDTSVNGRLSSIRNADSGSNVASWRLSHNQPISFIEAETGFLAFQHLQKTTLENATVSLIDQGNVKDAGTNLHRITVIRPELRSINSATSSSELAGEMLVEDLYFDMSTHLLLKSAALLGLQGNAIRPNLVVNSYANYQMVSGSLIPFKVSETVNGQHVWTLSLTTVTLSQGLPKSTFEIQ